MRRGAALPAPEPATASALSGALRGLHFFGECLAAVVNHFVEFRGASLTRRAQWSQRWGARMARSLGVDISTCGPIPRQGVIVANHLSYLDIVVLAATTPCVFVSKKEVADWPVFGLLAKMAGTIFVDRARRLAVGDAADHITLALEAGATVVIFPEGTSSDGREVLPFRASLLESALRTASPLQPAAIDYALEEGSVENEVCYWGEMTLFPHLMNLCRKHRIEARLAFAPAVRTTASRKDLARELWRQVSELKRGGNPVVTEYRPSEQRVETVREVECLHA